LPAWKFHPAVAGRIFPGSGATQEAARKKMGLKSRQITSTDCVIYNIHFLSSRHLIVLERTRPRPFSRAVSAVTPVHQSQIVTKANSSNRVRGAQKSCAVLQKLGTDIQWVESYITDDKVYCVYIARDEELVREHAKQGGFPADRISKVRTILDPTTAEA
jgi:hypothetical protein